VRKLMAILALSIIVAGVRADRLIMAPTGSILPPAHFKIEGALRPSEGRPSIVWANAGIGQVELQAVFFDNGMGDTDASIGAELQVLPETLLTPAVGFGIRDIADNGPQGRAEYLAVTKSISTQGIPWVHDVKLHGGFGVEGIDGFFAGAEVGLPFDLSLAVEHDSHQFNVAGSWSPVRNLELKVYSLNADAYFGAVLKFPK